MYRYKVYEYDIITLDRTKISKLMYNRPYKFGDYLMTTCHATYIDPLSQPSCEMFIEYSNNQICNSKILLAKIHGANNSCDDVTHCKGHSYVYAFQNKIFYVLYNENKENCGPDFLHIFEPKSQNHSVFMVHEGNMIRNIKNINEISLTENLKYFSYSEFDIDSVENYLTLKIFEKRDNTYNYVATYTMNMQELTRRYNVWPRSLISSYQHTHTSDNMFHKFDILLKYYSCPSFKKTFCLVKIPELLRIIILCMNRKKIKVPNEILIIVLDFYKSFYKINKDENQYSSLVSNRNNFIFINYEIEDIY